MVYCIELFRIDGLLLWHDAARAFRVRARLGLRWVVALGGCAAQGGRVFHDFDGLGVDRHCRSLLWRLSRRLGTVLLPWTAFGGFDGLEGADGDIGNDSVVLLLLAAFLRIRLDSSYVLVRICEHLGQQVVVVEVFQVVDLIEHAEIVRGHLLDVVQGLFIGEVMVPEDAVVVLAGVIHGWLVVDSAEALHVGAVLKGDF